MKPHAFDVVILGAGTAACATALALHEAGITDIALVEAGSPFRNDWVGESLPPDISGLLKALNLWEQFQADGHEPCLGSCAAWGGPDLGYNDFLANVSATGWHIHRQRFDGLLRRAVAARGIPIRFHERFAGAETLDLEGGYRLRLRRDRGEGALVARYVVDATGSRGGFSRCMGRRSIRHDLLVFIAATAALAPGTWSSRLTMAETVADGWWYAAALPAHRLSIAFATDPEISRARRLDRPEEWLKALSATRHIGPRLSRLSFSLSPLAVRAVAVSRRGRPCGRRWIAVGDAAAVFDPLGSEGIYKALEDGIHAAVVIGASLIHNLDRSDAYAARVAVNVEDHLALRRHFYSMERRWPDSLFWAKRFDLGASPQKDGVTLQM